jgi:hypothetical protein
MNSYNIADTSKLKMLFEQAFSADQNVEQAGDYDEYIALVAEGRIDLLPESVRTQVLDAIAYDPDSAALLKSLNAMKATKKSSSGNGNFKVMSITWAMAATLMFGLFMWRVVVPPAADYSFAKVTPYSTKSIQDEYWSQAQQQRKVLNVDSSRLRDYALIGSIAATCILSIVVLSGRTRRKRK